MEINIHFLIRKILIFLISRNIEDKACISEIKLQQNQNILESMAYICFPNLYNSFLCWFLIKLIMSIQDRGSDRENHRKGSQSTCSSKYACIGEGSMISEIFSW